MKLRRTVIRGAAVAATVGCLFGTVAATALAETTSTTGVGAAAVISMTIAEITANPVRDQVVAITGIVDRVIEGNEFIVKDDTGSATISIDGGPVWYKAWLMDVGLFVGQKVTITGEVDLGKPGGTETAPEIDVFTVTPDGGAEIAVRTSGGRPPWAGGPHKNGQVPGSGALDTDDANEVPDQD